MKLDKTTQQLYCLVANVLKSKMQDKNLTIAQLCKLSGISYKTITNLLKVKTKNARLSTVLPLFDILKISVDKDIAVQLYKK